MRAKLVIYELSDEPYPSIWDALVPVKGMKGKIVFKADSGEEYELDRLPQGQWPGSVKGVPNGFVYLEDETLGGCEE